MADNGSINVVVTSSNDRITYSAAKNSAPASGVTTMSAISGSATKTVKITKLRVSGSRSTSTYTSMRIIKRSTAFTGGGPVTVVNVPHDSSRAAATATVVDFAGNPTPGNFVGYVYQGLIWMPTLTAGVPETLSMAFGDGVDGPLVLNGVAESISFDLGGVAIAGANISWYIEWTEE